MPAHLRPPERHAARPIGVLAIALGFSLLVIAAFSGRGDEEGTTHLVQPAESKTDATVLGEVIESTVPNAPPASAAGVTTTTTEGGSTGGSPDSLDRPRSNPPSSPPPTIGPPVSVTRPPSTTSTTRPATTTTTEPTTTTTEEPTTTTTEEPTTTTDTTAP